PLGHALRTHDLHGPVPLPLSFGIHHSPHPTGGEDATKPSHCRCFSLCRSRFGAAACILSSFTASSSRALPDTRTYPTARGGDGPSRLGSCRRRMGTPVRGRRPTQTVRCPSPCVRRPSGSASATSSAEVISNRS